MIYSSTCKLPICNVCLSHYKALTQESKSFNIFLVLAIAVSITGLFALQGDAGKLIAGLMFFLVVIVSLHLRFRREQIGKSLLCPQCSGLHFVAYAYKPGGEHWFNFGNWEFAGRFAELNGGTGIPEESLSGALRLELRRGRGRVKCFV